MADALEHILLGAAAKRVLVVAEDHWLRFRLQHALEHAGCKVDSVAQVGADEPAGAVSYNVVVVDAVAFAKENTLGAVRAFRQRFAEARLVLLRLAGERALEDMARVSGFDLILERPRHADAIPDVVWEALAEPCPAMKAVPVPVKFQFVLEAPEGVSKHGVGSAFVSFVVHMVALSMALLVPLVYTEALDVKAFTSTWLMAPPPPPPPPPPPASAMQPVKRIKPVLQTPAGRLIAPAVIPKEIAIIRDAPESELDVYGGVLGGVSRGVPGGQMGGVIGGVIGGVLAAVPKPLPPPPKEAIRVGGKIRPPRLLRRIEPLYPEIAKAARIQGDVRIDAIIDPTGRVIEMKVLSGHALRATAALSAVQQWIYEPTFLNEQPIAVVLEVTVNFRLH